jgi:Flp pilus assembly protein TadG
MFNVASLAKRRRLSDRRRGAETLELALALPLLLVLAFGTIEFGYWFYLEHNFQAAAREGARAAIVSSLSTLADRQMAAEDAAEGILTELKLDRDKYDVQTSVDNGYLTVKVLANWKDIGVETGLFMQMHGSSQGTELVDDQAKIVGTATMRIEL